MADMSAEERLLVQRQIAAQIDYPSVYMGGPSPSALKRADRIISGLEAAWRIRGTPCGHATWESYRQHGTRCPTCGLICREPEPEAK